MRQAFSIDSMRDMDLATLAETMASCHLRQRARSCGKDECGGCATHARLAACMEQLPDCDVLRVQNMAQEIYSVKEFQYGLDRPSAGEALKEWAEAGLAGAAAFIGGLLFAGAFALLALGLLGILV